MNKWYENIDNKETIAVSTRVRLARNLKNFPFKNKINEEQKKIIITQIENCLKNINMNGNEFEFIYLKDLTDYEAGSLVEKHLISPDLLRDKQNGFVAVTNDQSISIMVNEEDHLRIQVLLPGMALPEALKIADNIDDAIDNSVEYAFDEEIGFLTSCPTNLGTGLRASVMLHLPALEKANIIPKLTALIGKLGFTIRGSYGEGTNVKSSLYNISNQITLGIYEEQAIQNLGYEIEQIMQNEIEARKRYINKRESFEDLIWRSVGILQNARILSGNEFNELSSNIRFGIWAGILKDIEIGKLNKLMMDTGPASICSKLKKNLTQGQRDIERAKIVRESLS